MNLFNQNLDYNYKNQNNFNLDEDDEEDEDSNENNEKKKEGKMKKKKDRKNISDKMFESKDLMSEQIYSLSKTSQNKARMNFKRNKKK